MNNLIMSMKRKLNNDNDDDSSQQKSDGLDDVSDNNSIEMGHLKMFTNQERSKKVTIRNPKSRLQMKKVRFDKLI